MTTLARWLRYGLWAILLVLAPITAMAAPFAAIVQDARTGEILYSKNADARLHPASLTKMMTLYIAFEAIERGEVSLDTMITVSKNAAAQPPSRLGLKAGQKIALRHLIRAAAIKSANDAASAIGDGLAGDEASFAARMNRTAKALGMKNSTFRNANGLTREGHLSSAQDMNILGRRLFYDYPQYYNIFSRRTADAGIAKVANTNRKFLDAYEGADGIKTGYTVPAGFNLTASAQRGGKRIIATVFGGTSTAQRNAKMAELLDIGFARAPGRVEEAPPAAPQYLADADPEVEEAPGTGLAAGKTIRLVGAPETSPRPQGRPGNAVDESEAIALALAAAQRAVMEQTAELAAAAQPVPTPAPLVEAPKVETQLAEAAPEAQAPAPEVVAEATPAPAAVPVAAPSKVTVADTVQVASASTPRPMLAPRFAPQTAPQPETVALAEAANEEIVTAAAEPEPEFDESMAEGDAVPNDPIFAQTTAPQPETLAMAAETAKQPETMILAALTPPAPAPREEPVVVARASSSGGRHWAISLGKFNSPYAAERALLKTALMESDALGDALRKVVTRKTGFEANFVGMTKEGAELACARLSARATDCSVVGP